MAETSEVPAVPAVAEIDPEASYVVRVAAPFAFGGARLGPLAEITATGAWLSELLASEHADKVLSARKG